MSAGFAQEQADRIIQLESQESLRQLQAQYDARRQRAAASGEDISNINPLRAELGDDNYERYLKASNRPTSAQIGSIISGSPSEIAGLLPGDNITSCAGECVFNFN